MEYSVVYYLRENEISYYEIDEKDRSMKRMVVLYSDKSFNIASSVWHEQYLETSYDAGCCTIEELNKDGAFKAKIISRAAFEKIWGKYYSMIGSSSDRIE